MTFTYFHGLLFKSRRVISVFCFLIALTQAQNNTNTTETKDVIPDIPPLVIPPLVIPDEVPEVENVPHFVPKFEPPVIPHDDGGQGTTSHGNGGTTHPNPLYGVGHDEETWKKHSPHDYEVWSKNQTALHARNEHQVVGEHGSKCASHSSKGITLVGWRWQEIGGFFAVTAFVIIAGMVKLGFHKLHWLSERIPESCLLILLGLAVGLILYFTEINKNNDECSIQFPKFTAQAFFLIYLPPIILDSAYSLHDRVFFDNLGTIIVFAVVGTIFNTFAIGGTLYGVSVANIVPDVNLTFTDSLVFSSLISAVDPVAVLAIFQEIGVNQNLYFLIFGESLLNDGVTVVLYNIMQTFQAMSVILFTDVLLAILSFILNSVIAISIGILYGILTALATKHTQDVRVVEPLVVLGLAYLAYISAELFHTSGIIGLIVCGLIQVEYGFFNISQKSYICIKYFIKMASATSDTVIFLFLGIVLVNDNHDWNGAFVLWSLIVCTVYRFIAVISMTFIMNKFRSRQIGAAEQFILSYGGLRGAIAFSLVITLDESVKQKNTFVFTTLMVVLFTVFIQGITIRPLVALLQVKLRDNSKPSMIEEIASSSMDHMMGGVEEVLGHHGDFYIRNQLRHYNDKYLKKWFLHEESDSKLTKLYEKIVLSEHYAHLYGPVVLIQDGVAPPLHTDKKAWVDHGYNRGDSARMSSRFFHDDIRRKTARSLRSSVMPQPEKMTDVEQPMGRHRSVLKLLPGSGRSVSLRSPARTPSPPGQGKDGKLLQRALRDNAYNKLNRTYNRNVLADDNQSIGSHLERRSITARRMTALVRTSQIDPQDDNEDSDDLTRGSMMIREKHNQASIRRRASLPTPTTLGTKRLDTRVRLPGGTDGIIHEEETEPLVLNMMIPGQLSESMDSRNSVEMKNIDNGEATDKKEESSNQDVTKEL